MTEQNKALRIGIITAAVVGAVAIPATALAANSTGIGMHTRAETSAALHAQVHAGQDFAGPARGRGGQSGEHLTALATALGTTPEALKEAMQAAREETKPDTKPADEAARQAHHDAYLAALAAKLNVSVDALKAALEANKPAKPARPTAEQQRTMLEPRVTQMVASGKVTQAQADQILADLDAGKPAFEALKQVMPGLGGEHGRGPGGERGPRAPQGNGA